MYERFEMGRYYYIDSCSRIFHASYEHKTLPKLAANNVEWRVAA